MVRTIAVLINDAEAGAGLERRAQVGEKKLGVGDFVVDLQHQRGIERAGREFGVVGRTQQGLNVRQMLSLGAILDGGDVLRVNVLSDDAAARRNAAGGADAEPAATGANVGHGAAGLNVEQVHNAVDLEPLFAARIFEDVKVASVWGAGGVRGRRLRLKLRGEDDGKGEKRDQQVAAKGHIIWTAKARGPSGGALQRFHHIPAENQNSVIFVTSLAVLHSKYVSSQKWVVQVSRLRPGFSSRSRVDDPMLLLFLAYFGGILTILSPCILPVLPFVFARSDQPFRKSGLPLLAGMAITFALVASLATVGGGWAVRANQFGRIAALILFAVFGLTLLFSSLADRLSRPLVQLGNRLSRNFDSGPSVLNSFLLGIGTGLLWAPCAGPILGLILTGAALEGASAHTAVLLLSYAAGAATSLAIALLAGGRIFAAMKRAWA